MKVHNISPAYQLMLNLQQTESDLKQFRERSDSLTRVHFETVGSTEGWYENDGIRLDKISRAYIVILEEEQLSLKTKLRQYGVEFPDDEPVDDVDEDAMLANDENYALSAEPVEVEGIWINEFKRMMYAGDSVYLTEQYLGLGVDTELKIHGFPWEDQEDAEDDSITCYHAATNTTMEVDIADLSPTKPKKKKLKHRMRPNEK